MFKITSKKKVDRQLLLIVVFLVISGFFIFVSASLGLLTKGGAVFKAAAVSQLGLGLGLGSIAMFIFSKIHYRIWKHLALSIFIIALLLTASVFIPGFGYSAGGATRWIHLLGISFQPAELLKIATILFVAAFLSTKHKLFGGNGWGGLFSIVLILVLPAIVLLAQPDTGTLVVIAGSVVTMFFVVGARWRDIGILMIIAIIGIGLLASFRPYVLKRLITFIHPWDAQQTTGYQIKQSLLAVGSGGFFGRGFGQSVQKFNYLPEPTSDSIFAVFSEEFGFLGSTGLILLFLWFAQRSLRIASRVPDYFGALTILGLSLIIIYQVILNITAMLGLAPLTGLPLPFISQGGTAVAVTLAAVGIILSVSRYAKI